VFISVLSFVIALGFIVYGLRLIALLGKMTHDVRSSLVKVRLVLCRLTDLNHSISLRL
jgi:hypothetical protein